jgi:two-component system, NarL family, response regulator NreC
MGESVRIVLADDHAVVRSALRLLLDAEEDLEVVAEAGDIESTVRYVRGHKPDVLVLDLNMPGPPSLPMIPELAQKTAVVVLTMQNAPAFAREALQSLLVTGATDGLGRLVAEQLCQPRGGLQLST